MNNHIVNHINNSGLIHDNTLHVIGVCSNPVRWHSRYRLAREFIEKMLPTKCVNLIIVEAAFGDRHHELKPNPGQSYEHLPIRVNSETWIKESMINHGARHAIVKYNAKYLAWVDMDVEFRDPNWAQETMHQLQHYHVVQPWQSCTDLGYQGNAAQNFNSFGFQHQRRKPKQKHKGQTYYEYAHSGYAWACTRAFFERVQGLMDFAILGSGDHHMAFAMIGETKDTIHRMMHPAFFRRCYEWQSKAMSVTNGEVGFTVGRIEHNWHGKKKRRYYRERWQILVDHDFNPDINVAHDPQGIALLVGNHKLEQAVKMYNRSRLEDSIDADDAP